MLKLYHICFMISSLCIGTFFLEPFELYLSCWHNNPLSPNASCLFPKNRHNLSEPQYKDQNKKVNIDGIPFSNMKTLLKFHQLSQQCPLLQKKIPLHLLHSYLCLFVFLTLEKFLSLLSFLTLQFFKKMQVSYFVEFPIIWFHLMFPHD